MEILGGLKKVQSGLIDLFAKVANFMDKKEKGAGGKIRDFTKDWMSLIGTTLKFCLSLFFFLLDIRI